MKPQPLYVIGPAGSFISDDPGKMDRGWVLGQLKASYWAKDTHEPVLVRSIMNSKPFGLYAKDKSQIGFARFVTDSERFAWLSDFILAENMRGQGLGTFFLKAILSSAHAPQGGKIMLSTDDAHSFYERFGFTRIDEKLMVLNR